MLIRKRTVKRGNPGKSAILANPYIIIGGPHCRAQIISKSLRKAIGGAPRVARVKADNISRVIIGMAFDHFPQLISP